MHKSGELVCCHDKDDVPVMGIILYADELQEVAFIASPETIYHIVWTNGLKGFYTKEEVQRYKRILECQNNDMVAVG